MTELISLLRESDPHDLPPFLAAMRTKAPHTLEATTHSIKHSYRQLPSGLFVPAGYRETRPADLMGTWVTLEDYSTSDPEAFFPWLASQYGAVDLLINLVRLGRFAPKECDHPTGYIPGFARLLSPSAASRLHRSLRKRRGEVRLLARQPILLAIKKVLSLRLPAHKEPPRTPVGLSAVFLAHAAASLIRTNGERSTAVFEGVPEGLLMDMVRLGAFSRDRTPLDQMSWYWELWTEHSQVSPDPLLPAPPLELLKQATRLDPAALWTFGTWFVSHSGGWAEREPLLMPPPTNEACQEEIDNFLSVFSAGLDAAAERIDCPDDHWDYRFIEEYPILKVPQGLLVLDCGLLLDRFTSGLFWLVANSLGRSERLAWARTYGHMAEDLVKRQCQNIAPKNLGQDTVNLVFDEQDIQGVYGNRRSRPKSADLVIDFGNAWVIVEIVTRNLKLGTRIRGEFTCLQEDIEAGVLKKARQIAETIFLLLEDEQPLTSMKAPRGKKLLPIIVIASYFPLEPAGSAYIRSRLATYEQLSDPRVWPLCLLDVDDFNYLEALVEAGHSLVELLTDWKASRLQDVPFSIYAKRELPVPRLASRVRESEIKMDAAAGRLLGSV